MEGITGLKDCIYVFRTRIYRQVTKMPRNQSNNGEHLPIVDCTVPGSHCQSVMDMFYGMHNQSLVFQKPGININQVQQCLLNTLTCIETQNIRNNIPFLHNVDVLSKCFIGHIFVLLKLANCHLQIENIPQK